VVFASTSDVYGKGPAVPFREADDLVLGSPQSSRWAYAVSKMYDEHLCFAYAERYGVRSTIIRYFGGYGPNQHPSWWGGPQSVFMEAVLAGKPLEIHGDGLQTRSFTYVDDLVKGTILAMESDNSWGEIFNIGDTREITIVELAEMIWRLMKKEGKPPMTFVPYTTFHGGRYEDVRRRFPDITKARDMLGFVPTVKLEDGLKTTIEWRMQIAREKIAGDPSGERELLH
jgi:UDP-glucose 4-epimerase